MEQWIDFAKGPLFALTFLIMVLGLIRLVIIQIYSIASGKGRKIRNAPWKKIAKDTLGWVVPVRHLIPGTKIFSTVSFLCHIGIILVPLFLADHIAMWEGLLTFNLPQIGYGLADFLTLFTIACLIVLFAFRVFSSRLRSMSKKMDYILLINILIPFVSGYMAMHPNLNPFSWNAVMLIHILSAELLFVLIPFTKLAHVVLFIFDRISGIHWQLRPGAGNRVAETLYGKEARV
jgi:nitrate reductase gamma subunit